MKYLIILLSILILGCKDIKQDAQTSVLGSGTWRGKLKVSVTDNVDDFKHKYMWVIIENCESAKSFNLSYDNDLFDNYYSKVRYQQYSNSGNEIFYKIAHEDYWADSLMWSIVKLSESRIRIQFNRMVSNYDLAENHKNRTFGEFGYGELIKQSKECNVFIK